MHSLLYRRFTRCTRVMCSFNNKVLADCQYSTRSCFSGMPCPCQGSKRTVKTIYAVQRVWPSLGGARAEEVMWENKLLRWSEDVGEETRFLRSGFSSQILSARFAESRSIRMDLGRKTGNKALELLFWEDELSSILDNFSDLQAGICFHVCEVEINMWDAFWLWTT